MAWGRNAISGEGDREMTGAVWMRRWRFSGGAGDNGVGKEGGVGWRLASLL